MARIITIWIVCLTAVCLHPCAVAQNAQGWTEAGNLPRRPANGVLDEAGLFQRDPARLKAVTARLQEMEKEYGFQICFAIYGVLLDDNPTTRAGALQRAWIGKNDGLVIVYEADTKHFGYGRDMEGSATRSAELEQPSAGSIPLYILTPLLGRVNERLAGEQEQGAAYIERMTCELTAELKAFFQRGQLEQPKGRVIRLVMLLVGVICGAVLLGWGCKRLLDISEAKRTMVFHFPEVTVGMRLGAPYGGGKISTRTFGGESRPG